MGRDLQQYRARAPADGAGRGGAREIALAHPRAIRAASGRDVQQDRARVPAAGAVDRGGAGRHLQQGRARSPAGGTGRCGGRLTTISCSQPRLRGVSCRGAAYSKIAIAPSGAGQGLARRGAAGGGARRGGARLTTRSRSRVRGRSGAGRGATDPARAPASDADRAGGHGLWAQYLRASGRHGQGREVVACVLRLLLSKEQRVCGDSQEPRARCACLELSRGVWSAYQAQTSQHASWGNENCSSLRGCHDLAGIGVTRSLGGRGPTGKLFWGKRASPDNSAQVL